MSEAGKRERHDAARFEWHLLAVARGEDQCDRIRAHASGREQERVAGRGVQPVGVIDQHEQQSLTGRCRKQRERRRAHCKTVDRTRLTERKRGPHQLLLGLGQLV